MWICQKPGLPSIPITNVQNFFQSICLFCLQVYKDKTSQEMVTWKEKKSEILNNLETTGKLEVLILPFFNVRPSPYNLNVSKVVNSKCLKFEVLWNPKKNYYISPKSELFGNQTYIECRKYILVQFLEAHCYLRLKFTTIRPITLYKFSAWL